MQFGGLGRAYGKLGRTHGTGGGSGLSPAMKARIQALIDAANGYAAPTTGASPPTMLVGTGFANSTINSATLAAPSHLLNDVAKFARLSPLAANGVNGYGASYATWDGSTSVFATGRTSGGSGYRYAFRNTAAFTALDMALRGFGSPPIRIRVNGEWVQAADFAPALSGTHYVKFTWGSAVAINSLIEVFVSSLFICMGMNISAGSIAAPTETSPISEVWGDSYVAGGYTGASAMNSSLGFQLAEQFGTRGLMQGRGGQGYVTLVDSRTINQRMVLDAGYSQTNPDLVTMFNSVNDYAQTPATVAANMVTGLQLLQAKYPLSPVLVTVGIDKATSGFAAGALDTIYAAMLAAKDARTFLVDGRSFPKIVGPDGTHPTAAERDTLIGLIKSAALSQWMTALGAFVVTAANDSLVTAAGDSLLAYIGA